ncbi:tetratricopeptide repeat protein [Polaribacter sp. Hel1_85]|uniref:tetratricopeptide repeat protein n=1 Tax=Polaribacter sp. Hel1_85 TaxID=1250005 RepID=UPI00052BDE29|nr:tetratricopeptide repeat protein [Polaribacter sp. Hel1_85]KGL62697.1 TPR repeat protein-containing protein [Polaribacter sp. Hel1_85]
MKKILIAMFFVANFSFSQEKIPFVDYDEIIQKISKEENNEKVISLINTLNKNDSAYYSLLISKSYYLLQLKKYEEALNVVNEGINSSHQHSKVNFYANKGVVLSNLKKDDKALENYNEGLKYYPKNYLLWFNKGHILEIQGKLNEAVNAYKKAISLNPTYTKPHLQIGNIYYKQERFTQALMCFNLYLLLEPDADGAFTVLKSLNNIVKAKNSNKRDLNITLDDQDDSFEDIDLVLSSKVAMNKNYKTSNPINIALVRQNHAMIAQLKNFKGNGGFWDKTYVPFYKWIAKNNKFDDFTYTLTYAIENEDYKKIIKNNTEEIIAFLADLKIKWANLVSKNNILFNGKQQEVTYEYSDSYVDAVGNYEEGKPVGFWQFYNESGRLTAEGNFDNSGERTGKWTWFTSLNKIKETAFYKDGVLEGKNLMFHNNGKKYVDANYVNDSLHWQYEYFNNKGALVQRKFFNSGVLDGMYKSYFDVGEKILEFKIPYKNGEIDGEVLEYYANGDVYAKSYYVAGKKNGLETVYHYNKKVSSEINYVNGELSGSYKSFHSNGKPNEVGQSFEGFYNGAWKTFYSDGTLESESTYKNGSLHDLYKYYDTDGKLFYEYIYRKGEIIAFTFYNKDATVLKKGKKKSGEFYYEGFSPKGNKTTEGLYDISGGKSGEWKFYTDNGVLKNKGNFKENKIIGEYFTYFKNGNIDNITNYKEDVIDGYYVGYHINGKMATQGWYKDGNQVGEWRYYNIDGTINAVNFYHKGMLNGAQKTFGVSGKLIATTFYQFGNLISEEIYDKNEIPFQKMDYVSKEKEYKIINKHYNGKTRAAISYVNEVKHGDYEVFYYNGNKEITGSYLNGKQNGLWTWYYENGNIESKANYSRGNAQGKVINYYKNGKIQGEYNFENDLEVGVSKKFYDNGVKKATIEYYEGKKHGKHEFYDSSGKLQLIRFYNHGEIIGYSYLDKNGTEIAMTPLDKESGKIEAFFDNGKPSKTMEYQFGDFINNYKSYFYSGVLMEEINYLDGNFHGVRKEYFENGNLKKETNYFQGEKQGKQIVYFENGNKKEEFNFANDVKHGMSFFYDEAGKLKTKKEYFNGKTYKVENL